MSTGIDELRVLYLGNDKPVIEIVKHILLDYFKCPVFVSHTLSPETNLKLLRGQKTDVILVPVSRDDPLSIKLMETASSACPDVPVICLTKKIGNETAAELIRRGASDCLPALSLSRLPYIIDRELIRGRRPNRTRDDMTEAQYADKALLDVFDGTSDGSCIVDVRAGTVRISETWRRRLGYTIITTADLRNVETLIHPEDRAHVADLYHTALRRRSPRFEVEFRLRMADDQYLWILLRGKLEYDDSGNILKYYAAIINITEYKKTVQALRASESRSSMLVSELEITKDDLTKEVEALRRLHLIGSVYMMLNDLNFIYDEILKAAIDITHADMGCMQIYAEQENCLQLISHRGLSEEAVKNMSVIPSGRMLCGTALEKGARVISQCVDDAGKLDEDDLRTTFGQNIRCGQATPLISCTGKIYGILNTFYQENYDFGERELRFLDLLARQAADFIERKRSEVALENSEKNANTLVETLKKVDRSKDDFLNHLAHELRNPLATIIAAISLIDISNDMNQIRETNVIIKNETKQLSSLIDDLLDVTRISTNRVKIKKKYINLSETVLSSANNFRPQFSQKKIRFITEADDTPIRLRADPSRIMQIVENLLMNALTYTDEGGTVVLSLNVDDTNAVICVEDNGIGVSPEELPMLFNAFYQAQKSPNRVDSGLGLGLSVVKGMAELHNGKVRAYSRGIGFGSAFTVTLPLTDGADASTNDEQP